MSSASTISARTLRLQARQERLARINANNQLLHHRLETMNAARVPDEPDSIPPPPPPPSLSAAVINLVSPHTTVTHLQRAASPPNPSRSPPREFVCPITLGIMKSPVVTTDGMTYERAAIRRWLSTHDKSPLTGAELSGKVLVRNHALRSAISTWKDQQARSVIQGSVVHGHDELGLSDKQRKQLRCLVVVVAESSSSNEDLLGAMIRTHVESYNSGVEEILRFANELSESDAKLAQSAMTTFGRGYGKASITGAGNVDNLKTFVEGGGIAWLCRMMHVHGANSLQMSKSCLSCVYAVVGCRTKGTTPATSSRKHDFVAAGGISAIVRLADQYAAADADSASKFCWAISKLSFDATSDATSQRIWRAAITSAGGLSTVVSLLRTFASADGRDISHQTCSKVCRAALGALWNLADIGHMDRDNCKALVDVVPVFVIVANEHLDRDPEIGRLLSGALLNIVDKKDWGSWHKKEKNKTKQHNRRIVNAGAIPLLVRILEKHGEIQEGKVANFVCGSLSALFAAMVPKIKKGYELEKGNEAVEQFVGANGLSPLLLVKAKFPSNTRLQSQVTKLVTMVQNVLDELDELDELDNISELHK